LPIVPRGFRAFGVAAGRYGDNFKLVEWDIHHLNPSDWLVGLEVLD